MTADLHNPFKRDTDLANLHPMVRTAIHNVIDELAKAKIPLRPFEAFRSPRRQAQLYAQGRTLPGKIVTYAKAWQSYHQYGLAVDFVFFVDGSWTWDEPKKGMWDQFHTIGQTYGLMPLNFETPHLQLAGTSSNALYHGRYPKGGDESWITNLAQAIESWKGTPEAPPLPIDEQKMPVS